MKIKDLIAFLAKQDSEATVIPAVFFGPGAPSMTPYEFIQSNFRTFKEGVILTIDAYHIPDEARALPSRPPKKS